MRFRGSLLGSASKAAGTKASRLQPLRAKPVTERPQPPGDVVTVRSQPELVDVVRGCAVERRPMFTDFARFMTHPRDARPVFLQLEALNKLLELNRSDMDCRVESGITPPMLHTALAAEKLAFPLAAYAPCLRTAIDLALPMPGSLLYGHLRSNILGMKIVLANGSLMSLGSRARKSSAGYDLTPLFFGAGGEAGLIVEATLKLHAIPKATRTLDFVFDGSEAAASACADVRACGLRPADALLEGSLRNKWRLQIRMHSQEDTIDEEVQLLQELVSNSDGKQVVDMPPLELPELTRWTLLRADRPERLASHMLSQRTSTHAIAHMYESAVACRATLSDPAVDGPIKASRERCSEVERRGGDVKKLLDPHGLFNPL